MKKRLLVCAVLGSVWIFTSTGAGASSNPSFLKVSSPDHPATWVTGALQESHDLRWDAARQTLVTDVTYSTASYADSVNPSRSDTYTLGFPNVKLAENGRDLIATNQRGESVIIGRRQEALFGHEIVLNKGVDLRIHRVDGQVHASLIYNALMAKLADK